MKEMWATIAQISCLFNVILLIVMVLLTRTLEIREHELRIIKRKIQSLKENLKKL